MNIGCCKFAGSESLAALQDLSLMIPPRISHSMDSKTIAVITPPSTWNILHSRSRFSLFHSSLPHADLNTNFTTKSPTLQRQLPNPQPLLPNFPLDFSPHYSSNTPKSQVSNSSRSQPAAHIPETQMFDWHLHDNIDFTKHNQRSIHLVKYQYHVEDPKFPSFKGCRRKVRNFNSHARILINHLLTLSTAGAKIEMRRGWESTEMAFLFFCREDYFLEVGCCTDCWKAKILILCEGGRDHG